MSLLWIVQCIIQKNSKNLTVIQYMKVIEIVI